MRKLKLDLDTLEVQTFPVGKVVEVPSGTVMGMSSDPCNRNTESVECTQFSTNCTGWCCTQYNCSLNNLCDL